ncbi:MAG: leucine-rich repeat protein [Prevotella sp.]|nr:leucine-rich repeat protein [Prevotella sp.]
MVRLFRLCAFVLLAMVVTDSMAQGYREGELIVKFRYERVLSRGMAEVEGMGLVEAERLMPLTGNNIVATRSAARQSLVPAYSTPTEDIDLSQLYLIRFDATRMTVEEAVKAYQAMDGVEYAEPNYLLGQISTSDDVAKYQAEPRYAEQWYLEAIRMPELWQQAITKEKRPVIAILDTGVDTSHPDLKDNIVAVKNVIDDSDDVTDDVGHGTSCASMAAAACNGEGMVGANPMAQIIAIKLFKESTGATVANEIKAYDFALSNGADIISMSYANPIESEALHEALKKASQQAVMISAPGNESTSIYDFAYTPGAWPEVIGVMATNRLGQLAKFSNYDLDGAFYSANDKPYNYELYVPGENVLAAKTGGGYRIISGTSFACPLAAGAISRLLQCRDFENREELVRALAESAGSHLDIMQAYQYQEPINGVFVRRINGTDMTFNKVGDNRVVIGDGQHASVSSSQTDSLMIPQLVAGYPLDGVADHAFESLSIKKLTFWENVKTLGASAFAGAKVDTLDMRRITKPLTCGAGCFDDQLYKHCIVRIQRKYLNDFQSDDSWKSFAHFLTDEFYWKNSDGVQMNFSIIDENAKIAAVSLTMDTHKPAIDASLSGKLTIPAEVNGYKITAVGDMALMGCSLQEIELPETIDSIGKQAFENCGDLESVVLPNCITVLPEACFSFCMSLSEVILPQHLKSIGKDAFSGCAMSTVTIPAEVTSIAKGAFDCDDLESVVSLITEPFDLGSSKSDVFAACETLYVPKGTKALYEAKQGWKEFSHIIESEPTAIHQVLQAPAENAPYYSIDGKQMEDAPQSRGLYIRQGKKVLVAQ